MRTTLICDQCAELRAACRGAKPFGATSCIISSYVSTNFQFKRLKRTCTYSLLVTKLLREQILSHYYINWSINQLYILLVLVIGQSINHF